MPFISFARLRLLVCRFLLSTAYGLNAQATEVEQLFDYYEFKGMMLKQHSTVESMLGIKQFRRVGSKERPQSTIYVYARPGDTTQIFVRVRQLDGQVNEVAWNESSATLGNLTHDVVFDGFSPVSGNSRYYNRTQKMALLVNYVLAENKTVPCVLRAED